MKIPYYEIDAFTSAVFGGNPAGVCLLEAWLPDAVLQAIAAENNLSETAFCVRVADACYDLRWFTPALEVDLCGHATLAPAHLLFTELGVVGDAISFHSRSGTLVARRAGDRVELDFPSRPPVPCALPEALVRGIGCRPAETLRARDYVAVLGSEAAVAAVAPDLAALAELDCLGIIVTAPGEKADFVSRFFAPRAGVPEDPVTGSAHCSLIPYWAQRLGRQELFARQISRRGGELWCRLAGERVAIAGRAAVYLRGSIEVPLP